MHTRRAVKKPLRNFRAVFVITEPGSCPTGGIYRFYKSHKFTHSWHIHAGHRLTDRRKCDLNSGAKYATYRWTDRTFLPYVGRWYMAMGVGATRMFCPGPGHANAKRLESPIGENNNGVYKKLSCRRDAARLWLSLKPWNVAWGVTRGLRKWYH